MQIGQGVHQIGRGHQEVFSTLGQRKFLGTGGDRG